MSYSAKYGCLFDPIGPTSAAPVYAISISKKDYVDDPIFVTGAGVPVIHRYQTDDPKSPIKGGSLSFSLINDGTLPLETFFSVNDDEYKVDLYWTKDSTTTLMFSGFLVQDDCSETLVDFTHEINLSANDNLGLLKDVALNKAKVKYKFIGTVNDTWSKTAPHTVTLPAGALSDLVQVGDLLFIHSLIIDFTYTVTDITANPVFTVAETVSTGITGTSDDISLYRPNIFADKITLLSVLDNCLAATGLTINTRVFCNFLEVSHDNTKSFIEQTLIDPNSFLKDASVYDDCYSILEKVLRSFDLTLFQAKGVWNIVHWDELRYSGYAIPGYEYDSDFNLLGPITLDNGFTKFLIKPMNPASIPNVYPETGFNHRVIRPFAFDKETFNYHPPQQLLRNYDLSMLGGLLNTYTVTIWTTLDGTIHYSDPGGTTVVSFQTYEEYAMPWWYYTDAYPTGSGGTGAAQFFIRIVYDNIGNEVDRYVALFNNGIHSYRVEGAKDDVFTYSFSLRSRSFNCDGQNLYVIIQLTNGTDTLYALEPGNGGATVPGWGPAFGFLNVIAGDTSLGFVGVSATSQPLPFDGLLYFYLLQPAVVAAEEVHFKDIRLDYSYLINQSTKIIGQTHTTTQLANIKQNNDIEIFIDDSPRNSLAGTLFLDTMTGLLQTRTKAWFLNNPSDSRRLGDLTTFETEYWRRKTRSVLEGTLRGLVSADTGGDHISMLSVFLCSIFLNVNYIWGKLEIDYKNNKCTGTLWEIYDEGETDADLSSTYEFKYLYAPK